MHKIRPRGEHHRGLHRAAVDAVLELGLREEPGRRPEAVRAPSHHEHPAPDPQLAGHHVHQLRLAAVAVEDDELAHAGAGHALADLGPDADQGLRGMRERAGKREVLVALAHAGDGQHRDRQLRRQQLERPAEDRLVDRAVHAHRQMGPVLLDRSDRQDRDDAPGVERGELLGGHLSPEPAREGGHAAHMIAGKPGGGDARKAGSRRGTARCVGTRQATRGRPPAPREMNPLAWIGAIAGIPLAPAPGMNSPTVLARAMTLAFLLTTPAAWAEDKVTFGTNWRAQAEHGGFYQAVATGLYRKAGLDVTIRLGRPQVNHPQLLAAGVIDFNIGSSSVGALNYVQGAIPMVTVAPLFPKDPHVLISHPGQGNDTLAAMRGKPILIGAGHRATLPYFLQANHGY